MDEPRALTQPPLVLVVDDAPANLMALSQALADQCRVRAARDGRSALQIASADPAPDLILLDIVMPDMSGFEVCRRLKNNPATAAIPVIFLTSRSESEDEEHGFELGAVDYVSKPISPPLVRARVQNHLRLKASADVLKSQNQFLEQEVARRTEEMRAIQDVAVLAVASLAETRDNETGNHIRRTQHYVRTLAIYLRGHPRFRPELDDSTIEMLFKSAPLHDIGKVGIPDRILLKPGRLDRSEFEIMKTHTILGFESIVQAEQRLGTSLDFLRYAKEIALSHQEKWDGSGYPQALSGNRIPLSARLMAVADVYDALISRRVYKLPFTQETSLAIMREGRGAHFDPDILDAFLAHTDEFKAIAERFADHDAEIAAAEARHSQALGLVLD
ncbi:MAG TPA: two-component system response regulator [Stellaceae bacterium]|jgi:putative two-component system response regulator|nr:two-component system response regulator [Stellaceae bacterium]